MLGLPGSLLLQSAQLCSEHPVQSTCSPLADHANFGHAGVRRPSLQLDPKAPMIPAECASAACSCLGQQQSLHRPCPAN